MKLRDANLKVKEKTVWHILLDVFCLHFLRIHHDYFFRRVFQSVRAQCLSGIISGLLLIYLFNYDCSNSTFSMLNMQLDGLLSFCQINLNSFVFCDVKITRTFFFLLCVLICTFDMFSIMVISFSIVFWHLYHIHTFINKFTRWRNDNISLDVYFFMIKICLREKKTLGHNITNFKRIITFRNYLPLVNLSLKSWFSEAAVHRCFSK